MDILISSNLERLLFELSGRDFEYIKVLMKELKEKGSYAIDFEKIKDGFSGFAAYMSDEENTEEGINAFYEMYDYVLDPHTAVAANVYSDYIFDTGDKTKYVIVYPANP